MVLKRLVDIAAAATAMPFVALMAIALGIAIRLDSKGSPLFLQKRVGRHEQTFTLIKFRTMRADTSDQPTHEIAASHVTRVGSILRRTKLDELPQLWNVLLGHMSLVGPRPCLPSQTDLIQHRRAVGVFEVRPGITGPAQIAGIDMSRPEALAIADAAYKPSFLGDLRCIAATVLGGGSGDRVAVD